MLFGDSKAALAFEKECTLQEGDKKLKYMKLYKKFATIYTTFNTYINNLDEITIKKGREKFLNLLKDSFLEKIEDMKNKNSDVEEYLFNLMKNILIIEFRKALRAINFNRYVYDKRCGCIAILDTLHQDYKKRLNGDRNGLASDDSDVVYFSIGEYKKGKWIVNENISNNVMEELKLLNKKCIPNNLIKRLEEK